jgi:F-type H+-transporting ATPase subunit alpha
MFENKTFAKLVSAGQPTAEVIGLNDFVVSTSLLPDAKVYSVVLFAGGAQGVVWQMYSDHLDILLLNDTPIYANELAVLLNDELRMGVGKQLLGRVVNPMGKPLDGKGFVPTTTEAPYFRTAPGFGERGMVEDPLESGVTMVDVLLPLVKGQRMAVMGDSKSGKTSFLIQTAINQARAGQIVVYVLVSKSRHELSRLVEQFTEAKVLKNIVLVVADTIEPLPIGFLAPFAGCAVAEYFWHNKQDAVIIYDDFSNHAKIYREMALLLDENVGREAYPGDMFHVHSALLERAGKLAATNSALTVFVAGSTPNNDLTGYESTSLISMSDGQIVFDLNAQHEGIRPAINIDLSVSRVGGRSNNIIGQHIATYLQKELGRYKVAQDYTRFADQTSEVSRQEIALGEKIYEALHQESNEFYTFTQQRLLVESVLRSKNAVDLDVAKLKKAVKKVTSDKSLSNEQLTALSDKLLAETTKATA